MHRTHSSILLASAQATALYQKTAQGQYVAYGDRALAEALSENKPYQNLAELWIEKSSCAKALLRHAGVEETFVKGEGSDFEKFRFFCTVLQDCTGNALKLQAHIALQELFECDLMLCDTHAEAIWQRACEKLSREDVTPRVCAQKCGVDTVLVPFAPWEQTDALARGEGMRVLPVFAPDVYFLPSGKEFAAAVRALDDKIGDFKGFCSALLATLDRFVTNGRRVARHSVLPLEFWRPNEYHAALYFEKALSGEQLDSKELALYQAQLWRVLAEAYEKRDMTLELLLGETAEKSEITRPVSRVFSAKSVRGLLDYLKERVGLPRVALYTEQAALIPTASALAARYPAVAEGVPQVALGVWQGSPADTRAQLRALASVAPLSACLGALPDARRSLSLWEPTLFHRALCTELADWEAHGETAAGEENLCRIITRLTGENVRKYYKL